MNGIKLLMKSKKRFWMMCLMLPVRLIGRILSKKVATTQAFLFKPD